MDTWFVRSTMNLYQHYSIARGNDREKLFLCGDQFFCRFILWFACRSSGFKLGRLSFYNPEEKIDDKITTATQDRLVSLRWRKTVSSTYIWMGRYNHSLSLDATVMASKNCTIIGEDVGIIFVTQYVTIATV